MTEHVFWWLAAVVLAVTTAYALGYVRGLETGARLSQRPETEGER